jgi:MFS family permease
MTEISTESGRGRFGRPGALSFAILYGLESLIFASVSTVVPLQALQILGNARDVSFLYAALGVWGLASALLVPLLVRRLKPRATYALGGALTIAGVAMLATVTLTGQVVGMMGRGFGAACLRIPLSLFTLGYIRRTDFTRSEPLKLFLGALPWAVGPYAGVWIYERWGPSVAFSVSGAFALLLLVYARRLKLDDSRAARTGPRGERQGLAALRRFVAQPRLRLAWLLAFGRHAWWTMFFVYVPIYMTTVGEGKLAGALVISAGTAMQFATPAMGWLGRRHGIRRVLGLAFCACGGLTVAAGALASWPLAVALMLVPAALAAAALDALGDIPFLRAVRPFERPEMTGIFSTYGQVAGLLPPAVFGGLLMLFDLPVVFVVSGLSLLGFAALTRYIPRRL